ncbi:hypothetical protein CPC08DRAFT_754904 [Agrocybe pediades]|nr:hypothetical protein CPC08DRAFT_754904 [Agrocybe pediades]
MGRGRPRKRARNLSGLQRKYESKPVNIPRSPRSRDTSQSADGSEESNSRESSPGPDSEMDDEVYLKFKQSLGVDFGIEGELESDGATSDESEDDKNDSDDSDWEGEELRDRLFALCIEEGDDLRDEDWVPPKLRKRKRFEISDGRPKQYIKGPDVMSKSARTQRRYKGQFKKQQSLDLFGFSKSSHASRESSPHPGVDVEAAAPPIIEADTGNNDSNYEEGAVTSISESNESDQVYTAEDVEDDLDEAQVAGPEIRSWTILRDQIKADLQKKSAKTLTPSQINKLLIIRNFATLRIKGVGKVVASKKIAEQWHEGSGTYFARRVSRLARHYQVFEQLPQERRGGSRKSRSLLSDESLKNSAREWLSAQTAGKVTPKAFQDTLNKILLPSLAITPKRPIGERTSRRWLLRLGWRLTTLKKGVYMDGHERADVVKYRQEVFIPLMDKHQARMAQWIEDKDGNFKRIAPTLEANEKEIIPIFQDESCFHANEYKSSAWLKHGQTILQGRGRLIHVSEYINPETGRLIHVDENDKILDEARKIIHPGSNGDEWWDTTQFLAQAKHAIHVFEKQFPGRVALFVFDQSSAHGCLPPDSLKAWEMNKSDGGKQRHQKDTIIPNDNPVSDLRGKMQKMTMANGEPKGLKRVLEERAFDVRKLKAKCKPYWGWSKFRYREVSKPTFADAKEAAVKYLDACPAEVTRRFINRSWRFLSAYRRGLTGHAAAWAVRKQTKHRVVTERAMLAIESIIN